MFDQVQVFEKIIYLNTKKMHKRNDHGDKR